jgi:hypothetical protein
MICGVESDVLLLPLALRFHYDFPRGERLGWRNLHGDRGRNTDYRSGIVGRGV